MALEVQGLVLNGTAPEVPLYLFTPRRLGKGVILHQPCSKAGGGGGEAASALGKLSTISGQGNSHASYGGITV